MGAIKLGPLEDNLFEWKATMPGPEGSVYEGGLFDVQIKLAHDYPYVPQQFPVLILTDFQPVSLRHT